MTLQNWRNIPPTTPMPGGAYDPVNGGWKHVGMGSWNGTAWTYQIHHFSEQDLNPNEYGQWVLLATGGQDPNGGATICGGSAISVGGGSVSQNIGLPTYHHRGRDYGVTLNYNSGLAGNRTLGTGPTSTKEAVPSDGVGVSVQSMSLKRLCLPQNEASQVIAGNPGSCGLGACGLEAEVAAPWNVSTCWLGSCGTQSQTLPSNADSIDVGSWVPLPVGQDGTTTTGSGFVSQQVTAGIDLSGSGTPSCVTGGAFGSPNLGTLSPASVQAGPALFMEQEVLVYHRHNSPFGPGWAIDEIPRLYAEPGSPDHVTLVRGDGSAEDFRPRPSVTVVAPNLGNLSTAFAVDPVTGDNLMTTDGGSIVRINGDGTTTSVVAGLSYDGPPQSLAVTYINGQRGFLVALTTRLLWIPPGGGALTVYTRSGNSIPQYAPSQVAARGDLALYTEGKVATPVLYRIRLSSPPGAPEVISAPEGTGADIGLDPTTTSVSGYSFFGPAGLAYSVAGQLFVADVARSAVYLLGLDMNGEIGPTSSIAHVAGDGAGRWVPPAGSAFPGVTFPINQPFFLSTSPDGTLLIGSNYGVAAYDPVSTEAEWIAFDHHVATSDLAFDFFVSLGGAAGPYTNIAATGPRSFLLGGDSSGLYPSIIDASQVGSSIDPTRSVASGGATRTLVDTTQALVETYDAQGRLTGETSGPGSRFSRWPTRTPPAIALPPSRTPRGMPPGSTTIRAPSSSPPFRIRRDA